MKFSEWRYKVLVEPIMSRLLKQTGFYLSQTSIPEWLAAENVKADFACHEYHNAHDFANDMQFHHDNYGENDVWIILRGDVTLPNSAKFVDFSVDEDQLVLHFCKEEKELEAYFFHALEGCEEDEDEEY